MKTPTCLLFLLLLPGLLAAQPAALSLTDFRPHDGKWRRAGDAMMSQANPKQLILEDGEGVIANGVDGKTTNLLTERAYADLEVHVEFLIPEGSNSGVYLMGRYEVQIRDSHGVEEPRHADAGGIYQRWEDDGSQWGRGWQGVPPRVNAAKPAGAWQSMDILFRAPRFDAAGNKTADARFVQVVHNGIVVQQDVPVTGPTRAATFDDEQPRGPLMFQGDHGPVAYRNIRVRELHLDHAGGVIGQWQMLDLENAFDIVIGSEVPGVTADEVFEIAEGEIRAMYDWDREGRTPSGLVVSKARFSRFDIEFEIKSGPRQFPPREDQLRNGGFLYHIQGTTPIWPPCLEAQGMETNRGDHWSIRGVNADQVLANGEIQPIPDRAFARGENWAEAETAGWNKIRVEVRGDRAKYFVNGVLVNAIRHARFGDAPCTAGFIGFQAEHAEMTYRNIRLRYVGTY